MRTFSFNLIKELALTISTSIKMFFENEQPLETIPIFLYENLCIPTWNVHILFFILLSHVSIMFDYLCQNLDMVLKDKTTKKLEAWRQDHVLVCQLVDNINDCFGAVLLTSIGCYFISFITNTYELYTTITPIVRARTVKTRNPPLGRVSHLSAMFLRDAVHIGLLVAMPHRMDGKVRSLHMYS